MLRVLKWILLGIIVAVLAAAVAVELILWNFLKPRIAAQVESATGRKPSIDGDVEVDLVPGPRITLHDVSLANPDWVDEENFIELEAGTDSLFSAPWADGSFDGHLEIAAAGSRVDSRFSLAASLFPAVWQTRIEADIKDVDRWVALVPGVGATGIGALALEASLARSGSTWTAENVDVTAMESSLRGDLEVDTVGEVPAVKGSIRSKSLNWTALRDALPAGGASAPKPIGVPRPRVLPRLSGSLAIDIAQIAGLSVPITDAAARIRFGMHSLALENVDLSAAGGSLRGFVRMTSAPESVSAGAELSVQGPGLGDDQASGSTLEGDFDIRLAPVSREQWRRAALVRGLKLETAALDYRNPAENTRLSATVALAGASRRPVVTLAGTFAGRPLDAEIEGDGLVAAWPGPAYGLHGEATSADLALSVGTTLDSVLNAEDRFDGRVSLSGDSVGNLAPWLGLEIMPTPPFHLSGRLERSGAQWGVAPLSLELGDSSLRGDARFDGGERPRVAATLEAEPLDLGWLKSNPGREAESAVPANSNVPPDKPAPDLAWLRSFDADLELEATELILPGLPHLDGFQTAVVLEAGTLEVERLSAGLADGRLSIEGRLDAAKMPAAARIDTRFDDIALGRLGDTFSPLEDRLGRLSGSVNLEVTQTLDEAYRDDVAAPMLGRLRIESSSFRFIDPEAGTDLCFSARTEGLAAGDQRFRLDGSGRYDGKPAWLRYRSDALLDVRLPDRPYAVDLDASVVESHIELDGTLLRPLALEGLDLRLSMGGPNPQRLTRLLGVPLPDLPPYRVAGQLELKRGRWSLSALDGRVGESDLRGRLAFDTAPSPAKITGELRSDSLDIDDLAGIAGGEGETGQAKRSSDRFVLPDEPLVGEAWRGVDADVRYRGKSVRAGGVPLTDLVIDFRLSDGQARFEPVGFGVGDGSVDFTLELDACREPAGGKVDLADERFDISIVAHPQDASVLIGRTPFHLSGTFDDIEAGIHGGELAARLGASVGLAALATPLGALIPLLEAGVDDRTGYCQGLVKRTMQAIDSSGDGS